MMIVLSQFPKSEGVTTFHFISSSFLRCFDKTRHRHRWDMDGFISQTYQHATNYNRLTYNNKSVNQNNNNLILNKYDQPKQAKLFDLGKSNTLVGNSVNGFKNIESIYAKRQTQNLILKVFLKVPIYLKTVDYSF